MAPIEFPEVNAVIAANQPPYMPLPVHIVGDGMGTMLSCWELTEEDMAEIINTKRIWMVMLTFGQPVQPVGLSTDMPVWEEAQEISPAGPACSSFNPLRSESGNSERCQGCGHLESEHCVQEDPEPPAEDPEE